MAIEAADLREILFCLSQKDAPGKGRLLILGNAQVPIERRELRSLLDEFGYDTIPLPEDLTALSLGALLGFSVTETIDINGEGTITYDLTESIPEIWHNRYDMVIDAGVLFWCFNPGNVLVNVMNFLKSGGYVVHITAISGFYGRGYYNIHPKMLLDFYEGSGGVFLGAAYRSKIIPGSLMRRCIGFALSLLGVVSHRQSWAPRDGVPGTYLARSQSRHFSFLPTAGEDTVRYIPNDTIGVLMFRKSQSGKATKPVYQ